MEHVRWRVQVGQCFKIGQDISSVDLLERGWTDGRANKGSIRWAWIFEILSLLCVDFGPYRHQNPHTVGVK